ncbi:MAG: hypothetical protein JSS57_06570 [Proteobacteria bacterium]|nr:hypothetical protein [Pseudomonadota bacterium]
MIENAAILVAAFFCVFVSQGTIGLLGALKFLGQGPISPEKNNNPDALP